MTRSGAVHEPHTSACMQMHAGTHPLLAALQCLRVLPSVCAKPCHMPNERSPQLAAVDMPAAVAERLLAAQRSRARRSAARIATSSVAQPAASTLRAGSRAATLGHAAAAVDRLHPTQLSQRSPSRSRLAPDVRAHAAGRRPGAAEETRAGSKRAQPWLPQAPQPCSSRPCCSSWRMRSEHSAGAAARDRLLPLAAPAGASLRLQTPAALAAADAPNWLALCLCSFQPACPPRCHCRRCATDGLDHGGLKSAHRCWETIEAGPCRGAVPRWAFDGRSRSCIRFSWGGCKPGGNNFRTQRACSKACR